jgi:hypothetical protein
MGHTDRQRLRLGCYAINILRVFLRWVQKFDVAGGRQRVRVFPDFSGSANFKGLEYT